MSSISTQLARSLEQSDSSARLKAAISAGTYPDDAYLDPLLKRCAVEPDFSVREMLTWALTSLTHELVLGRVIGELDSPVSQARSQALHTLSKLRDDRAWPAITDEHLHDPDDEVARTAWRTAVVLAPETEYGALASELKVELGRGDLDVQRSLARAFVELGEAGNEAAHQGRVSGSAAARIHAAATIRLIDDPGATFYLDPGDS